jgi:hypothetical protein
MLTTNVNGSRDVSDPREHEHPDPSRDPSESPTTGPREHAQGARSTRSSGVQRRRYVLGRVAARAIAAGRRPT